MQEIFELPIKSISCPDFPRIEYRNSKGEFHREDGPAIIYHEPCKRKGDNFWRVNGLAHRVGGPSYEWISDGLFCWFRKAIRHRLNAPAYISIKHNNKEYYEFGIKIYK
jgi:hypothetical protein